jgi:hypothetical protein
MKYENIRDRRHGHTYPGQACRVGRGLSAVWTLCQNSGQPSDGRKPKRVPRRAPITVETPEPIPPRHQIPGTMTRNHLIGTPNHPPRRTSPSDPLTRETGSDTLSDPAAQQGRDSPPRGNHHLETPHREEKQWPGGLSSPRNEYGWPIRWAHGLDCPGGIS